MNDYKYSTVGERILVSTTNEEKNQEIIEHMNNIVDTNLGLTNNNYSLSNTNNMITPNAFEMNTVTEQKTGNDTINPSAQAETYGKATYYRNLLTINVKASGWSSGSVYNDLSTPKSITLSQSYDLTALTITSLDISESPSVSIGGGSSGTWRDVTFTNVRSGFATIPTIDCTALTVLSVSLTTRADIQYNSVVYRPASTVSLGILE